MRDRLFFPVAAALAGAFILMALNPFAQRVPTGPVSAGGRNPMDLKVEGAELHRFLPGNYDSIDVIDDESGKPSVLRITRKAGQDYLDPRSGPHLVLAEDLEIAFEKRKIEVQIEARSAGSVPASQFEADYFAKTEFESGWQKFELTSEFKVYSFTYTPPAHGESLGYDYVGVRPIAPDKQRTMEVRSIRFVGGG
ncbi:MAG: hypothetical protein QM773_00230 [Hyphomonadaceae bacterium]